MATQAATLCGASALVGAAVGKGVKKQAVVSKKLNQTRLSVSASASSKDNEPTPSSNLFSKLATGLAAVATTVSLTAGPMDAVALTTGSPAINPAIPDVGVLIKGQPIKDARALLRYALPINNQAIKEVQQPLEAITEDLRLPGSKAFDPVERNIRQANRVLNQSKDKILADVAEKNKAEGRELIEKLQDGLQEFQKIVERRNRDSIQPKQKELLAIVGDIEEAMVGAFPYQIPAEFKGYPVLKGRANVEMTVRPLNNPNLPEVVFEVVVDGYNAPVTSGNFVDLVKRGFYDGMEIQRADGFVVQTGDPEGPAEGFVDPATGKERRIPLEVFVEGDKEPVYHDTLEDLGRYRALPKIPFNAFGTMAMAREEFDNDSASSQIFWLLKESELTPSSANILDGRYAVFGYIVENADFLADLKAYLALSSPWFLSRMEAMASQRSLSSDDTKATMSSQPHPSSNQQNADPNGSNVSRGSNRSNGSNNSNGSPIVVLSYRQAARLAAMSTVVLVLLLAAAFHLGRMSIGEIAAVDSSRLNNLPAVSLSDISTLISPETPRRRVLRSRGRPRPAKPAKKPAPAEKPAAAENPAPVEKPAPAKKRAPARKPAPRKKKPQAAAKVAVKEEAKEESKSGGDIKEVVEVPADQAAAADDDAAKAAEAAAAAAAAAANGAGGEGGGGANGAEAGGSAAAAAAADPAGEPAMPASTVEATPAAATSAPEDSTSAPSAGAAIPATTVDPTAYYTAEGLQRLQDPCGGIGGASGNPGSSGNRRCYNRCHRRTRSGYCVKELLSLYDEAYSPLWPARVDLVVRSYVSDNFFLTAFLFASIEQMWPAGIGDVILVLDESDRHVEDIVPPWVK
ncbi:unnamed protein product, partial [Closterium sp. NIES-53]